MKKDVLVCNESKQDVETSALTEWKNAICVRETFNRYTFFLDNSGYLWIDIILMKELCWKVEKSKSRYDLQAK